MKSPIKLYFTVITNGKLDQLEMYRNLSDHDEYGDKLHDHTLHNGTKVRMIASKYRRGYKFVFDVPEGTCLGAVLYSLKKYGKQWLKQDYNIRL